MHEPKPEWEGEQPTEEHMRFQETVFMDVLVVKCHPKCSVSV